MPLKISRHPLPSHYWGRNIELDPGLHMSDDMVRMLLDRGADVNAKDDQNETALDWAEYREYADIVELLTKHLGTQ